MNATEAAVTESLRELLTAPGPCITIAVRGDWAGRVESEMKNTLKEVERQLRERGIADGELLAPLREAGTRLGAGKNGAEGIVILRAPSVMQVLPASAVAPLTRVHEHFDVRTVLGALAEQETFYILALSQNRTRIVKCTRTHSEEIPFPPGFPTSLEDAMQTRQPDHMLDNRASGGPSIGAGAVMFGTSSDRDAKDEYMLHFFSALDRAVHAALRDSTDPLIAVGVEHELALYRRVNTYANLVEPGVHGAPDGLDRGEMHKRALELMRQRAEQLPPQLADLDKRGGGGLASTHIHEIVVAAYDGRISHLFFQANARYMGTYDHARQRVKHTEDPLDSPVDLIESAAVETIRRGGEAALMPASAMPNGAPVCALFRYPIAQPAAELESRA